MSGPVDEVGPIPPIHVDVPKSGRFEIGSLAPGRYTLTGAEANGYPCSEPTVRVAAGRTAHVTVTCSVD